MISPMAEHELAGVWRRIIRGDGKSWVVFAHATCVVLPAPGPADDLAQQAVDILREYGPLFAGSAAGDFGTLTLEPGPGWVVYGHHNDVLTYVGPDEITGGTDLEVGLHGRAKRDRDGRELNVVHVEDKRVA
ncbi:hypothetical protein GCM10010112_92440 [Actinoplanes lobatus]|uniref:Uncharacterized protein n=2 Tax=Actinoplanes lobatus TaxID=113568 RepID=A0ABQ4AZ21_9ACTN|nr:hypothetical protein GCM10010112_92440 [Actinoplanes lobatus]GIE46258.1 hypothetical protein Alo02nite_91560 [Actinoplanes lobatus]